MKKSITAWLFLCLIFTRAVSQPGTLDPSFGVGGKVLTDLGGKPDYGWSLVMLPDNKIVAGGTATLATQDFALVKYNSNGTADNSFGTNGKVTLDFSGSDDWATKVLVQPDSKLVLCGNTFNGTDDDFAVARFNPDGSLDAGFGSSGKVTLAVGPEYDRVNGAVLQPDGKILVVGVSGQYYPAQDVALARFNSDGTPDATFGTNGKTVLNLGQWSEEARDVTILGNGKILIAGYTNIDAINYNFLVMRLNSDGTPDPTFAVNGVLAYSGGLTACGGYALKVLSDGRFYVAGVEDVNNSYNFVLMRFLENGAPDVAFGAGGMVTGDFDVYDMAKCLVVQPDNKVVVGGYSGTWPHSDFALARYTESGVPDAEFGNGGLVLTDFAGLYDMALGMVVQPDGKIVAAGYADNGNHYDFALARYETGVTASVGDVGGPVSIEFRPNPVRDQLAIRSPFEINSVLVFSVTGSCVFQGEYHAREVKLDLSNLPSGSYLVRVQTSGGTGSGMIVR